jgi:hypothetical protein
MATITPALGGTTVMMYGILLRVTTDVTTAVAWVVFGATKDLTRLL